MILKSFLNCARFLSRWKKVLLQLVSLLTVKFRNDQSQVGEIGR